MSRNHTPVLTYFFGILLTVCAAEDKRCEVLDVHVTPIEANSSFVYNTTYKDPSCTNKGELTRKLRRCNATFDYGDVRGEGEVNYCHGGMWMVTVSENVNSACFHCWGFYLQHAILLSFTYDLLSITLKDVPPTVKSWNLTIYKSTIEQDYKACKPHHGLTHIKKLFQDTHLKANITRSLVTLKHSFDPNACYCLVMNPISHLPLSPDNILFTTKDCRPTPPSRENGTSPTGYLPMSTWKMVGWGVLAGTLLCFVAMIFVVLRLKRLVADQYGWTEQGLLSTSGEKMQLVKAVGLHEKTASLLDSDKESSADAILAKKSIHNKTAENLLTFALKTAIGYLREDCSLYSWSGSRTK